MKRAAWFFGAVIALAIAIFLGAVAQAGPSAWGPGPNLGATDDRYVNVAGDVLTGALCAEGATDNAFEACFAFTDPTADRTITFPNASITVNAAADISGTTLAANVTGSSLQSVGTLATLAVTGNITWGGVLCEAPPVGDSGKVLTSDGAGGATWETPSGGGISQADADARYLNDDAADTTSGLLTMNGGAAVRGYGNTASDEYLRVVNDNARSLNLGSFGLSGTVDEAYVGLGTRQSSSTIIPFPTGRSSVAIRLRNNSAADAYFLVMMAPHTHVGTWTDYPIQAYYSGSVLLHDIGGEVQFGNTKNKPTCTLNGAATATCTATVRSGAKCVCDDTQPSTNGVGAMASVVSGTTLTVTSSVASDASVVQCLCG